MTSLDNPNFYVCTCGKIWTVFDLMCPICGHSTLTSRRATQKEVNDNADEIIAKSKLIQQARHQLPEGRVKVVPTREEFETALDRIKKMGEPGLYDTTRFERENCQMIIKRYKHHHQ